jgi:hypothetical protein
MKYPLSSLAGLMLLAVTPLFAGSRESAFLAQKMLGPEIWSRVVRIESAPGENNRFPAEYHGLVIAFADILWLYTDIDGTQNLSSRRGQLAADKENLGELLRGADPALVRFTEETAAPPERDLPTVLPNACFVACVKHWQMLMKSKHPPKKARLIACFPTDAWTGHMLLEYRRGFSRVVFDPDRPDRQISIPFWVKQNALTTATRALKERWPYPPSHVTSIDFEKMLGPSAKNLVAAGSRVEKPQL